MFSQNRLNDLALHADASAMNNADLVEATPDGLVKVFLKDDVDLFRLECVEIDGVLDGYLVHDFETLRTRALVRVPLWEQYIIVRL